MWRGVAGGWGGVDMIDAMPSAAMLGRVLLATRRERAPTQGEGRRRRGCGEHSLLDGDIMYKMNGRNNEFGGCITFL